MSVTNIMLEAFMQLSTTRQEVLSKNVSHSNTPGYLGQDISVPSNFSDLIKLSNTHQVSLSVTNTMHILGSKPKIKFRSNVDFDAGELKPNGNNVDLPTQAKKAAENQLMFETAMKAYSSSNSLLEAAIGKK